MQVGIGFDVHRLVEGRKLVLGGVEIPFSKGLAGHSDADVLLHAISDALLGGAAKGDIGQHFPKEDPQYKGISSLVLLERVRDLLSEEKLSVNNIDAVIVAERPKLAPYLETMKERIAQALGMDKKAVNVKATTTEGLTFTGREEGMAAYAVATLI